MSGDDVRHLLVAVFSYTWVPTWAWITLGCGAVGTVVGFVVSRVIRNRDRQKM